MNDPGAMTQPAALAVAVAAPVGGIYDYLAGQALGASRGSLVMVPFGGRHFLSMIF